MTDFLNLKKLVKYCRHIQVVDDSDVFVGVTGRKGVGKTTFSIEMSREYVKEYFGEDYFSVRKYVAFNNNEIFEKLHTLEKYSPIAGDEAIRFAWSRDWNKSDNKDLVKLSTQIRPKKHILLMNIPKMVWIDKAYREGMLSMWAWIQSTIEDGEKKSYAILFEPDENQGVVDSWHLKELTKSTGKIRKIGRFSDLDQMYKMVKDHPCFMDIVPFGKVPKETYDQYMELRTSKVMEKENEYVDQKDMAKIMSYNIKNKWENFNKTIAESRFGKPTYRIIADNLCFDPTRKKQLIQHTTVKNWIDEIEAKIPTQTQLNVAEILQEAKLEEENLGEDDDSVY